jgi:hypothetical protein
MSDPQALAAFLDKWRGRWPEWHIAQAFVPHAQRETAAAWFALLQELTDAAWAGEDPRPGEAKLGWWTEELLGWSQNRRRHPLGLVLQRSPAPWSQLAAALPSLLATREAPTSRDAAFAGALPLAEAISAIDASLFDGSNAAASIEPVLARHLMLRGDGAAPLQLRARLGDSDAGHGLARAWAAELLANWQPMRSASRPDRVFAALLRKRVHGIANGRAPEEPIGKLATLLGSWQAARC